MLEKIIARSCAPALAGIKPSNIVSCRKSVIPDVYCEIERLNKELNPQDIYLEIVCDCPKCALVMVYRKNILKRHLNSKSNRKFLMYYGYPDSDNTNEYIAILKNRLKNNAFPHEIGVFLGYPLSDIYSFINHRNEGCLLVGEWKVYHNPEAAAKLFHRFKACRKALAKRVYGGQTLAQVFCAV